MRYPIVWVIVEQGPTRNIQFMTYGGMNYLIGLPNLCNNEAGSSSPGTADTKDAGLEVNVTSLTGLIAVTRPYLSAGVLYRGNLILNLDIVKASYMDESWAIVEILRCEVTEKSGVLRCQEYSGS